MFEALLLLGAVLWFTLAVATGAHARGHGRSGILWFLAVAVTGVFGFAFYLLAITSSTAATDATTATAATTDAATTATAADPERSGSGVDKALVTTVPKYVGSLVAAGLATSLVGYVWLRFGVAFTRSPETFDSPLTAIVPAAMLLFLAVGLLGGAYVTYEFGLRRLAYALTYAPVASLGVLGGLDLLRLVAGPLANFHGNLVVASVPLLVGGLGGVALALLWRYLCRETFPAFLRSVRGGDSGGAVTAVTSSRREVLAATGGSVLFLGGRVAQARSRPEVEVTDTAVRFTGDEVFADVTVSNPRSQTVVVNVDAEVDIYETFAVRDIPTAFRAEATTTLGPWEESEVTLGPIEDAMVDSESNIEVDQVTLTVKNSIWSRL